MRWTLGSIGLLALLVLHAPGALAQDRASTDRTITVLQPKPVLRASTLELRPRFTGGIGNPMVQTWGFGGALAFSPGERWFLSAGGDYFDLGPSFGGPTARYRETIRTTNTIPEIVQPRWAAGLEGGWVPFFGKFAFFNRTITYFDLYFLAGVGAHGATSDMQPTFTLGVGGNLYLSSWLSLFVEARDRMSIEELGDDNRLFHSVTVATGLGVVIPMARRDQSRTVGGTR